MPLSEANGSNKANFKLPSGTRDSSLRSQSSSPSKQSDTAAFKNLPHSSISDRSSSSSLSPPPSDDILEIEAEDLDMSCFERRCPLCNEVVPRAFLEALDSGLSQLSWQQKVDVCEAHKRRAAGAEWTQQRYPEVDWDAFEERLERFHEELDNILDLRRPSFYRDELERRVNEGKSRNAFRNPSAAGQETIVPGYYGLKGAQRMQSHLVELFSDKIRNLATTDKLIPATGPAGYVQAVLVPELAVMLVREDLHVDEERAREVLCESADVGNLVHSEMTERVGKRRVGR